MHGPAFLNWLQESSCEREALGRSATRLADFLIDETSRLRFECPDAPLMFWKQIPVVRKCCKYFGAVAGPRDRG
jgi:hypothetical protein